MAGYKVVADFSLCESNAVCMGFAPEVFEVDERGFLNILQEQPPTELLDRVRQAVDGCPTQALGLQEIPS